MTHGTKKNVWPEFVERYGTLTVVFLALAASITGIRNGFAYDDVRAIYEDTRFHSLGSLWHVLNSTYWLPKYGGSLYRPLTSLGFAVQWLAGGGSPLLFHLVSIALYAAVCAAVFRLSRQVLDETASFVGATIFAVHPVHVEAVANVVGQAELGAALFVVLAVSQYIRWTRTSGLSMRRSAVLCAMYAIAVMFKENAIVLPALIVAADFVATPKAQKIRERVRRIWPLLAAMAFVGVCFVIWRAIVIGSVSGAGGEAEIFLGQPFQVRVLTMLTVVVEWIRLFVWPAKLSADYSSPRIDVSTSLSATMIPAILVVLGVIAIALHVRKAHPAATFAFMWAAIGMLIPSNLIVVTGVALAERALFLPSIGVSMLAGALAGAIVRYAAIGTRRAVVVMAVALVVAGIVRSSYRNPVWKNNATLFRQTVEDVPYSWKSHLMLGELLVSQGKSEGALEMSVAVKLSPRNDVQTRYVTARRLHIAGQQALALPFYADALALDPSNAIIRENAAYCLAQMGRMSDAVAVAKAGLRLKPGNPLLTRFLQRADSVAHAVTPDVVLAAR